MNLKINEIERYSRQIILKDIGISGQKKLKKSKVLIVGLGGLGCPTAAKQASQRASKQAGQQSSV